MPPVWSVSVGGGGLCTAYYFFCIHRFIVSFAEHWGRVSLCWGAESRGSTKRTVLHSVWFDGRSCLPSQSQCQRSFSSMVSMRGCDLFTILCGLMVALAYYLSCSANDPSVYGKHKRVSAVYFVRHSVWFDGHPCLPSQSQCQWSLSSMVSMGVSAVWFVHHSVWLNDDACLLSQPQCPTTPTGCTRGCQECCVLFSLFTVLMDCAVHL